MGNDIVDLSGQTSFYVRVRSKDSIRLGFQLRSGDGSTPNRSVIQQMVVPGDTMNWTEITFSLDTATIGGFDSTDLRDVWFFLDRGQVNFAGNQAYFDYIAIGSPPDPADNSACLLTTTSPFPFTIHWADTLDPVFTNGGAQLTQTIDTTCSQLAVSVTDTAGDPLAAFKSLVINPKDNMGNDIADFSGQLRFYVRLRSKDSLRLGFQLRSGDGSAPNRTTVQQMIVPGDTANWTEVTFIVDSANLGGFDSTDLRDIWFFLDRGDVNFAGNEAYFDYIAIGSQPDPADNSPCSLTTAFAFPYVLHWADTLDRVFSAGGEDLTQIIDTTCSQLALSVTDPTGDPLPAFRPLLINPTDESGDDITDLSGQLRFHVRVRSKDSVRLGFQLRSGDGSAPNRTDILQEVVPGDTMNWTEITFTVDSTNLGGFDSTDLRDVWFFLDRGDVNFAGDEFYFDYIAIGSPPDPADNSPCSFIPPFEFPYVLHWADTLDRIFTAGGGLLNQVFDTTCSQLALSVKDSVGDPLPAFRPIVINPTDEFGNDITDFSGQLRFYARLRSKDSLRLGFLARSGDGSAPNRTTTQEIVVSGDLTAWTEVSFFIDSTSLGGFDSTDLRDFWFYLDRGEVNFAGDELYFDYVSVGAKPDPTTFSNCVETVGIEELPAEESLKIYPNPSYGQQAIQLAFTTQNASELYLRVYDGSGKLIHHEAIAARSGAQEQVIAPKDWAAGLYTIQLVGQSKVRAVKWVIR
ncbi:MAG: T9SS type A sorting domain-containing protein [Bacteroidota bacterium]